MLIFQIGINITDVLKLTGYDFSALKFENDLQLEKYLVTLTSNMKFKVFMQLSWKSSSISPDR